LLVIVALLFGSFAWLKQIDGVYRTGQTIPLGAGLAVDLTHVEVPVGRCLLVRVTADQCPYCKQDQPQYAQLKAKALEANCGIVAVGPREGALGTSSPVDTLSLQYVDFEFGRALMPFLTPQTLVVDGSRRLLWQRQGALNDNDVSSALRTLGRLQ
jgi:hypothetical protein